MTTTAVRERPILFSGEMVRAILDGRKTQTRRVVRPQPWAGPLPGGKYEANGPWVGHDGIWRFMRGVVSRREDDIGRCPYGQPGDRLYVRETFALLEPRDDGDLEYRGAQIVTAPDGEQYEAWYRADGELGVLARIDGIRWIPSIHMPRWASRITLEIMDVRVERVQDITDEDCYAEGLPEDEPSAFEDAELAKVAGLHVPERSAERHWFRVGWDRLNARRGFGWDANPWVWAITFRRLEAAS